LAQTFQGSLRGRVTDPSGPATFGAKIAIADEAKSAIRFVLRAPKQSIE